MGCAGKWIGEVVGRMAAQLHRWGLWLRIRWRGRQRLPSGHRRWLNHAERGWRRRVEGEYAPGRWEVLHLRPSSIAGGCGCAFGGGVDNGCHQGTVVG